MSYFQRDYSPPSPPAQPPELRTFEQVRAHLSLVDQFMRQKATTDQAYLTGLVATVNQNANGFGADIASAATISVTNFMHVVTGTATISTINVPLGFNGQLELVSHDGFSTTTGGNIANAITAPANSLVSLVWVPSEMLWYVTAVTIPDGSITTAKLANNAVTTVKLAAGAATESGTVTDNSSQNITPYDTEVQVATMTVVVNATSDLVEITGRVTGTVSNAQSLDESFAILKRGSTTIENVDLKLTLSTATIVGGSFGAAFTFHDTGISGSTTYNLFIKIHNGSGNGTYAMTKTSVVARVVDLRAQ